MLGNESTKRWMREKTEVETEYSLILRLLLLLVLQISVLDGLEVTAVLETDGGNETLDLGSPDIRHHILLLPALYLAMDNTFANIILLGQVEHLVDVRRPLGTKILGENSVREAREF